MPEALQERLRDAGVVDDASLRDALEHDPELLAGFEAWLAQQDPQAMAQLAMAAYLDAFARVLDGEQMLAFWRSMPGEIEEPFVAAVEVVIQQAQEGGDEDGAAHLAGRLEAFQQIRRAAQAAQVLPEELAALAAQVQNYLLKLHAADAENPQVASWTEVAELGEELLAAEGQGIAGINWLELKSSVAGVWNTLGNAHSNAGDKVAALDAYERAVTLQPEFAMWQRNRAGALVELGRLGRAQAANERARALEPEAARLPELEAKLAAALEKQTAGGDVAGKEHGP
jgi:tetratricopeptide (TPR) repeat protein